MVPFFEFVLVKFTNVGVGSGFAIGEIFLPFYEAYSLPPAAVCTQTQRAAVGLLTNEPLFFSFFFVP